MTVVRQDPNGARRLISWAWAAIAFVPVALLLAIALGFANEGDKATFVGGFLFTLLVLAIPTVAVVLGVLAAHAHLRAGRSAELFAVLLLVAVAMALPLFVTAFGVAWLTAVGVAALIALIATATFWTRVERR